MADESTLFGLERWSPTQLAEALGLSTQRISQLSKENILPPPVGGGRYAPLPAVKAYVQHLRQREAGRSRAGEAVRKLQLENEIRHIKLQRIAGELVPLARVQKDFFEVSRRVRDGLLNLPARLSGIFAAELNQQKIFDIFSAEIHQLLCELSGSEFHDRTIPPKMTQPEQDLSPGEASPADPLPDKQVDDTLMEMGSEAGVLPPEQRGQDDDNPVEAMVVESDLLPDEASPHDPFPGGQADDILDLFNRAALTDHEEGGPESDSSEASL